VSAPLKTHPQYGVTFCVHTLSIITSEVHAASDRITLDTADKLLWCSLHGRTTREPNFMFSSLQIGIQTSKKVKLSLEEATKSQRVSSVGIVTRYGLDGPGIESRWGERFSALVQAQPPIQWVPGHCRG
jgi:hypothetical protein